MLGLLARFLSVFGGRLLIQFSARTAFEMGSVVETRVSKGVFECRQAGKSTHDLLMRPRVMHEAFLDLREERRQQRSCDKQAIA